MNLPKVSQAAKRSDKAAAGEADRKGRLKLKHEVDRLQSLCRHSILSSAATGARACRVGTAQLSAAAVDSVETELGDMGYLVELDGGVLTIDWSGGTG